MSHKYGSIHIFGSELEKNILILKEIYNSNKSFVVALNKGMNIFATTEMHQMELC